MTDTNIHKHALLPSSFYTHIDQILVQLTKLTNQPGTRYPFTVGGDNYVLKVNHVIGAQTVDFTVKCRGEVYHRVRVSQNQVCHEPSRYYNSPKVGVDFLTNLAIQVAIYQKAVEILS